MYLRDDLAARQRAHLRVARQAPGQQDTVHVHLPAGSDAAGSRHLRRVSTSAGGGMGGTIAVPTYRRLTWSFTGAGSRVTALVEKPLGRDAAAHVMTIACPRHRPIGQSPVRPRSSRARTPPPCSVVPAARRCPNADLPRRTAALKWSTGELALTAPSSPGRTPPVPVFGLAPKRWCGENVHGPLGCPRSQASRSDCPLHRRSA